jgi:hypothetical protein
MYKPADLIEIKPPSLTNIKNTFINCARNELKITYEN